MHFVQEGRLRDPLKIVFFTVFIDVVGFSIVFPLFAAMIDYYVATDGDDVFLRAIFSTMSLLAADAAPRTGGSTVVFGGVLGGLYCLLQFVAAPLWGALSDRFGRKPILLVSLFCLGLGYLLWAFAASFSLLLISRFIGGLMGGSISAATAVVADVTGRRRRSAGMAVIGAAFALGMVAGPVLGGLSSLVRLDSMFPFLVPLGFNPFSSAALAAAVLSFANFVCVALFFRESLPRDGGGRTASYRTADVRALFRPLPGGAYPTAMAYFFFLVVFSGMEFTLVFLTSERWDFDPVDNAWMFVFVGFVLALVQGGATGRWAARVGEKNLVVAGFGAVALGLGAIGASSDTGAFYGALALLAFGSALAIPCLTALVSLYSRTEEQGRALGAFRSLGALARALGPLLAAWAYWRFGSRSAYFAAASVLAVPLFLALRLPPMREVAKEGGGVP